MPSDEVWGFDDIGEWLPAIAERHSIGTVQGSEWLGQRGLRAPARNATSTSGLRRRNRRCYAEIDPTALIYVPKGQLNGLFSPDDCCPALRTTLEDAGYSIVYDGPGRRSPFRG